MTLWHAILVFIAGMAIGLFYFGGLWLTIQQIVREDARAPWLLAGSFLVRALAALGLLYGVANGRFLHLIIAILGFFLVRLITVRRWGTNPLAAQTTGER